MVRRHVQGGFFGTRDWVLESGLARPMVAFAVLLLHGTGLWALQAGLSGRSVERVVPVQVMAEPITPPPTPEIQLPIPVPPRVVPVRRTRSVPREPDRSLPKPLPAPSPVMADAPLPETVPAVPVVAPVVAAAEPHPPPPAPPQPPPIVLPSSTAAYLDNPPPRYPAVSFRLGEQGEVIVRVLIEIDGTASQAQIAVSSGFSRLDQAALRTARGWRYVPGRQAGVPQAMWFDVPIRFVIG